jgi:TonB family protein
MKHLEFIPKHQLGRDRARHFRAFVASCLFHGFLVCLLIGLTFLYWPRFQPLKSGSPQGGQSISLPTLVIVAPSVPVPPDREKSSSPPPPRMAATEPQPPPIPKPPEKSVPVPAPQPVQAPQAETGKTRPLPRPTISHASPILTDSAPPHAKPVASAPASSYAPGASVLPHPPYPPEARDHGQVGTVTVSVQFDAQGSVTEARVMQSSGVPLLDSRTRTFIRDHWHSLAYAGQTVNVPIRYTLENL